MPPTPESVDAALRNGDFAQAEEMARTLLRRVEGTPDSSSIDTAKLLDLLVTALLKGDKANDPSVRALAERAISIKQSHLGASHPGVAASLRNLGIYYEQTGDYGRAKSTYEDVLSIREAGGASRDLVESLTDLGIVLRYAADYNGARSCLQRALTIGNEVLGPDDPALGLTWNVLGNVLMSSGEYTESRRAYERALAIRENALGRDHPDVAGALNNLGSLLIVTGDYESARHDLERALRIRESRLGPEHPQVATALTNLADCSSQSGDSSAARSQYERALAIFNKSLGGQHPMTGACLWEYARFLGAVGDHDAAKLAFERAATIDENSLGPESPELAACLQDLAEVEAATGEYRSALRRTARALTIRQLALGSDHPKVGESFSALALLFAANHENGFATDAALRAEKIGRDHLRGTMRALAERSALLYASVRPIGLDLALSLLAERPEPDCTVRVWDSLIRSRALVYDEMAARHSSVVDTGDPEVSQLADRLNRARAHFANLMVRGGSGMPPETYRALVGEARDEKEDAERKLAEASLEFRQELASERIGFDDITRARPRGSALVAYVLYNKSEASEAAKDAAVLRHSGTSLHGKRVAAYLAFVLPAGTRQPIVVSLGTAAEIDRLVSNWYRLVSRGVDPQRRREMEMDYGIAAEALRRVIWDPLAPALKGANLVFVVPDGALQLVNVSTLPAKTPGKYLIETDSTIHYLSAERDLIHPADRPRLGQGLLVVGGPDFDADFKDEGSSPDKSHSETPVTVASSRGSSLPCTDLGAMRFPLLPGSLEEANQIAELWRDARKASRGMRRPKTNSPIPEDASCLTGREATEAAFKRYAPGKRAVHLATHGFLAGVCGTELESTRGGGSDLTRAIGGSDVTRAMGGIGSTSAENPFLLAGVVFAGANRPSSSGEDAILTAEEVASLDLHGVDWVVLSACNTGIGEVRAREGVFGLRRAFQVAGARTLIMSLWAVQDDAARKWMRTLYQARLGRGFGTSDAVRQANLEMLRNRREKQESTHPFYWSGFVAVGDWR